MITKDGLAYAATIPTTRYTDFIKSTSPGAYFNLYIKPFASVQKVDVPAMVAAATATPSAVAVPSKSRKAPAKSLLPHKPAPAGATDAWIDFRCIADPTTGPGLVKALKRFIELKGEDRKKFTHYIPYIGYGAPAGEVGIAALTDWGTGYVDPKYLMTFPEEVDSYKVLANAYRSAYKSWVKRLAAKGQTPEGLRGSVVAPAVVAAKAVWDESAATKEVNKALAIVKALEAGKFDIGANCGGWAELTLADGKKLSFYKA